MPLHPHAYMFGCFEDHILTCTYVVMLTCSYLLGCHICTWKLIFSHTHFLNCSHAWMFTCLNAHTLTCFDDHMLPSSHALLIRCYYAVCFDDNMLPCTLLLIFTCLISTYTCTHLVDDMSLCLED